MIGILARRHVSHQPRPGEPFSIGSGSLSAITTLPGIQGRHISAACAGARSATQGQIRVVRGLPADHVRTAPQSGTGSCSGGTSCRTGLRGRLAGSGFRPWPFFLGGFAPGVDSGSGSGIATGCGVGSASARARISWAKAELSGVDPLALLAVALAEELFELMLEFGVEMDLLAECLQQLADELMGRFEIVWEWVRGGDHPLTTLTGVGVFAQYSPNFKGEFRAGSSGRGVGRCSGRCRPAGRRVWRLYISTRSAAAAGMRKVPRSSLLAQTAKPSRSQYRILMRSRRLLTKTKR